MTGDRERGPDPFFLLAVDPGTHAAFSFWERVSARVWALVRVGRTQAPDIRAVKALMGELLPAWSGEQLVVEGQFYVDHRIAAKRGYQASPWKDVETLIELRCWWQAAAVDLGAGALVVDPGRWINAITKGFPGATTKDRIRAVVRALLPGVELEDDEHDAALLGCWWIIGRHCSVTSATAEVARG